MDLDQTVQAEYGVPEELLHASEPVHANTTLVRFYKRGDRDFIRIQPLGDPHTVIDTEVEEQHKLRFRASWAAYTSGRDERSGGTPLSAAPWIDPETLRNLEHAGITLLEQLAMIPASALDSIPVRGLGELQQRAQNHLQGSERQSYEDLKAEHEALKGEVAEMRLLVAEMLRPRESNESPPPVRPPEGDTGAA